MRFVPNIINEIMNMMWRDKETNCGTGGVSRRDNEWNGSTVERKGEEFSLWELGYNWKLILLFELVSWGLKVISTDKSDLGWVVVRVAPILRAVPIFHYSTWLNWLSWLFWPALANKLHAPVLPSLLASHIFFPEPANKRPINKHPTVVWFVISTLHWRIGCAIGWFGMFCCISSTSVRSLDRYLRHSSPSSSCHSGWKIPLYSRFENFPRFPRNGRYVPMDTCTCSSQTKWIINCQFSSWQNLCA